ncbi:hydrogenase maturation protease [Saccharothrix mutabilis subsp. mutabilis]|uniref:Hydrogenase maturation protease n=1 Tax=Saccharothrix mutabilis subsp. mutabilis TaxID=66855 RepID=A0ABN0UI87_9PSEU
MRAVVVGVGNEFRRDDGIGPAVARSLARRGVRAEVTDGDPVRLMEAWADAELVVVVDAMRCAPAVPGRVHRVSFGGSLPSATSSHGFGVPEAVELADALGRLPDRLVVFAVEVAEVGFGLGLTPAVAAAVPTVEAAVLTELGLDSGPEWMIGNAGRDV